MTRSVSKIITAARDRHPAFDAQRVPPGPLYRFLADYCAEMQGKIAAIDSTFAGMEQTLSFSLPLADFGAGLDIGAGRVITDIQALDLDTVVPRQRYQVSLISRDQRFDYNAPAAAAWEEDGILYLKGTELRWQSIGTIEVKVIVPMGDVDVTALQAANAVLPLPDSAALAVTEALAHFAARRTAGNPKFGVNLGDFADAKQRAEEAFYQTVFDRNAGRVFFTTDAMRYFD